VLTAIDL